MESKGQEQQQVSSGAEEIVITPDFYGTNHSQGMAGVQETARQQVDEPCASTITNATEASAESRPLDDEPGDELQINTDPEKPKRRRNPNKISGLQGDHVCPHCPFRSEKSSYLKSHMRRHSPHPECHFKCPQCEFWVRSNKALKNHLIVHIGILTTTSNVVPVAKKSKPVKAKPLKRKDARDRNGAAGAGAGALNHHHLYSGTNTPDSHGGMSLMNGMGGGQSDAYSPFSTISNNSNNNIQYFDGINEIIDETDQEDEGSDDFVPEEIVMEPEDERLPEDYEEEPLNFDDYDEAADENMEGSSEGDDMNDAHLIEMILRGNMDFESGGNVEGSGKMKSDVGAAGSMPSSGSRAAQRSKALERSSPMHYIPMPIERPQKSNRNQDSGFHGGHHAGGHQPPLKINLQMKKKNLGLGLLGSSRYIAAASKLRIPSSHREQPAKGSLPLIMSKVKRNRKPMMEGRKNGAAGNLLSIGNNRSTNVKMFDSSSPHQKPERRPSGYKGSLTCHLCPFRAEKPFHLEFHQKRHQIINRARFKCDQCPYWVSAKKSLVRHLKLHQTPPLTLKDDDGKLDSRRLGPIIKEEQPDIEMTDQRSAYPISQLDKQFEVQQV